MSDPFEDAMFLEMKRAQDYHDRYDLAIKAYLTIRRIEQEAPDLLRALEVMVNMYVETANSGDCGTWDPETEDEVIFARNVIRKAKGE